MNSGNVWTINKGVEKRAGRVKSTLLAACAVAGLGLPGANALAQAVVVNCPGDSIQAVLNLAPPAIKGGTMTINGTCTEDVLVTLDNATFAGGAAAVIRGTITIDGARRVVLQNLSVTGSGNGVVVTGNGTATVRDSIIGRNNDNGIVVKDGAQADILNNQIVQNGQNASDPGQGPGISVYDGGNARVVGNSINDNLSYGVEVFEGGLVRLETNTIMRNGHSDLGGSGVGVWRARVRANGNVYQDNGYAAIEAENDGSYRTGMWLHQDGKLDNPFGFETITAGTGQVAVTITRSSHVDLRQVIVQGAILISNDSLLQARGDHVGPNTQCSEVDDVTASGVNSTIKLSTHTRVNGVVTADSNQGNRVAENSGCPLP